MKFLKTKNYKIFAIIFLTFVITILVVFFLKKKTIHNNEYDLVRYKKYKSIRHTVLPNLINQHFLNDIQILNAQIQVDCDITLRSKFQPYNDSYFYLLDESDISSFHSIIKEKIKNEQKLENIANVYFSNFIVIAELRFFFKEEKFLKDKIEEINKLLNISNKIFIEKHISKFNERIEATKEKINNLDFFHRNEHDYQSTNLLNKKVQQFYIEQRLNRVDKCLSLIDQYKYIYIFILSNYPLYNKIKF